MDFHSLTRKELQALCKKNKIPANITNVAMADALTALEIVEGLEELLNQSQSPEKAVPELLSIPRTANRTSTRRKPIKEEPGSAQPTASTCHMTRRAIDQDLDLENKTPAVQTGRRRTQAVSARRKVEEGSVQRGVCSTRRSVRLLEKNMADLSLKERGILEPVEMDVLDETEEKQVSENLEKTNDSAPDESIIEVLESEKELKDVLQEKDNSDDNGFEVSDMVGIQNTVSVLGAVDDSIDETSEVSNKMGTFENPSANIYDEIAAKDHKADVESGDHVSENASAEVMESENVSDKKDLELFLPEEEDLELPFDPESWETDDDQSAANVQVPHCSESDFEALVDVNLSEGEVLISYEQTRPFDDGIQISTSEIDSISKDLESNNMIDVYVMPAKEFDTATNLLPLPLTPTSGKPEADTIATQFPRPTKSTPLKTSSKKQTTDQKLTLLSPADNKENIDPSGIKVEPKKKKTLEEEMSLRQLRQLTKKLKEQLEIQNKKKNNVVVDDDEQASAKAQVGKKTRPALQTLPENVKNW